MRIILAMFVALAALGAAPAGAAAPVEAGKVYSGPEGEEVALVPLTPREAGKFLVRVQGTASVFDGKVFLHESNDWSSSSRVQINYFTQWRGRPFGTLVVRGSSYELHVPGRQQGIAVKYDEARTAKLKAEEVYAQHQKQDKDGSLAKLMAFDRAEEIAPNERAYVERLEALNAACGASVSGSIDWSTISDELLKSHSISGFCEAPLTALRALCDISNEAKRAVQEKVKRVDCRFGTALEPRIEGGRVVWTMDKDASNQHEAATRFFKQNL